MSWRTHKVHGYDRTTLMHACNYCAGVDDFCKVDSMADSDASRAVVPAEVVYIESRNIEAVKEALAKCVALLRGTTFVSFTLQC